MSVPNFRPCEGIGTDSKLNNSKYVSMNWFPSSSWESYTNPKSNSITVSEHSSCLHFFGLLGERNPAQRSLSCPLGTAALKPVTGAHCQHHLESQTQNTVKIKRRYSFNYTSRFLFATAGFHCFRPCFCLWSLLDPSIQIPISPQNPGLITSGSYLGMWRTQVFFRHFGRTFLSRKNHTTNWGW